jgi:hypothetical protein
METSETRRGPSREVVAAVRLDDRALGRLQELLVDGLHLVDIADSSPDAELVVCPPCSPQTISALQRQFPHARVIVTELEDGELGVDVKGPVSRSLDAGASAYLTAGSVEHLAAMLSEEQAPAAEDPRELVDRATGSIDDEILAALARLADTRTGARQERPRTAGAQP